VDEETKMAIAMVRDHHNRLRNIEEYIHFPPDYGPSDHVHHHVAAKLDEARRADNQAQFVKSAIFVSMLFLLGLIGLGVKVWISQ